MTPMEKVERYVRIAHSGLPGDLDELAERLKCDGINADDAECLIAFVPMAFAHEMLKPLGVKLPGEYDVKDFHTGASARGRLKDEPLFVAAKTLAHEMLNSNATRQSRAAEVAAVSAEMATVLELSPDNAGLRDVVLTEPLLTRLSVSHVKQTGSGSRWKFWKRN